MGQGQPWRAWVPPPPYPSPSWSCFPSFMGSQAWARVGILVPHCCLGPAVTNLWAKLPGMEVPGVIGSHHSGWFYHLPAPWYS